MNLKRIIKQEIAKEIFESETKKDACYHKVKARYDVWPSAYASGALSKCRKVGADNWGNNSKKNEALDGVELTDEEEGELKDVSKQLKGSVKAHGKQAKTLDKVLKKENKKNCGCGHNPCKTYGIQEEKKKAGTEYSKESSLRDWFGRKGEKGSKSGWVDCNAPDGKGGYKACGRSDGEKRRKHPACRPTPGACKEKGKGTSWGKKSKKEGKITISSDKLKQIIKEEYSKEIEESLYYGLFEVEGAIEEKKKKPCKPSKGKSSAKRVDGRCVSYGQAGKAKGGGPRVKPGTSKGDAYCARSYGDMKSHGKDCSGKDRGTPLCLSRQKWKCSGEYSKK
jgi:hypothetical protein